MNEIKPVKKRPFFKKLAFASADILGGGSFNIINFLYPAFLALTLGLSAYWCGIVLLLAKVWDGVIDPIIGYISDHTKSRWGKRRVYLIFVSPLLIISFFLLFFPFQIENTTLSIIVCLLTYILFSLVQSAIMIPYYSLSSEISKDYNERASYNSYRLGFSIFSSIICVAIPGLIVNAFGGVNGGYQVMGLSFGILFALATFITGFFSREEVITPPSKEKFSVRQLVKPLKIKSYRLYLLMYWMVQMAMAIMSGLFFFYIDFYICKDLTSTGSSNSVGLIGAALMFGMQIVALPVYLKIIKTKGKTFAYRLGGLIWILSALALLLIPLIPTSTQPLIVYLLAAIMGFGISGPGLVPHTMFGDIVDVGEVKLGERLDGQMGGFTNFVNQISQALGLFLMMTLLGVAGFVEQPLPQTPENTIRSQPEGVILAIQLIMALTPLVLMGIGMLVSYKYKIDAKKHLVVREALEAKDPSKIQDL
ncbi:MAG: MFS transporter [Erysipelotrichaceae bacterium]|jgi:oligogalacturonide transporter|nr:MFS transporter [Erysipelotrichaceae bacterium]